MNNTKIINEIKRLKFEDFLWVIFIILSILNIIGDHNEKEFLETNNAIFETNSNKIFEFTLIITLLIYIYFFMRNYDAYKKASHKDKELYLVKILGSSLLIAGIICLLFFQTKQSSFIGSPAL